MALTLKTKKAPTIQAAVQAESAKPALGLEDDEPDMKGKMGQSKWARDNSDLDGKKAVRDWCLDKLGGAANCGVLELFGGLGHVYDACYREPPVKAHMAFDLRVVNRPTWIVGDNRSLITDHVHGWNLYDLDAYGNPWVLAKNICRMREAGTFGFAITCGIYRGMNIGQTNGYIRQVSGYKDMPQNALLARFYKEIVGDCVRDWQQYGVTLKQAVYTLSEGPESRTRVVYYAFIVEKA